MIVIKRGWAAVLVLAGAPAACAKPFPEPPDWKAGYPNLYTLAFASAATEAFVRDRTGQGYYDVLDKGPYSLGSTGLCTTEGLADYLDRKVSRCDLFQMAESEDCSEAVQCIRLEISPVLMDQPRALVLMEAAFVRPCAHITDWRTLRWDGTVSSNAFAPRPAARILRCGRDEVVGTSIRREPDGRHYRIHFDRRIDR